MKPHNTQPRTTQVDPTGIARLYLRTPEIPDFFTAQQNYCEYHARKQSAYRLYGSLITLLIGIGIGLVLLDEFGFGEDEGVIVIFWGIGVLIALGIIIGIFSGKIDKLRLDEAKSKMLSTFFAAIADDLHPDSGLKGIINHGKHGTKDVYKRKTSPYSGAKKVYYKYPWATLKFMLLDGTSLRLKCVDKLKEKSSSVVRFQEIGKTKVAPNTLLYDFMPGQHINLRKDLCHTQHDLLKHPETHGESLAALLKQTYQRKMPRRSRPVPASTSSSTSSSTASSTGTTSTGAAKDSKSLMALRRQIENSALEVLITPLGQETLELRYAFEGTEYVLWLDIKAHEGQDYVGIRLPVLGDAPGTSRLLLANAALAYGRFAYIKRASGKQLCLFKPLLLSTLDPEELETAIQGLCRLSQHWQSKKLPTKTRAYRQEREPDWEKSLINNAVASLPLAAPVEMQNNKVKVRLKLPKGRQQTVHVRFDRQDAEGNQLIALQSYCGADNAELYDVALEENSQYSYGALGLGALGGTPMFAVYDHQLAETADPPEITHALMHIAQKADQMEDLLTGADVH